MAAAGSEVALDVLLTRQVSPKIASARRYRAQHFAGTATVGNPQGRLLNFRPVPVSYSKYLGLQFILDTLDTATPEPARHYDFAAKEPEDE